jgi:3-hydroxybutyryl-CoA dehydratase
MIPLPFTPNALSFGNRGDQPLQTRCAIRYTCLTRGIEFGWGKGETTMSFTAQHLYFDDVEVGQQWESLGRTITETDIVNFAGLSGDFNPIHIDHEFAKTTPFRRPIAQGLLVFSVASGLGLFSPPMRTMAILNIKEWQFAGPIFIGDTIHVRSVVLSKEVRARGRRGEITWRRLILNQEDKVVQEGVTVTLVQGRAAAEKDEATAEAKVEN